MKTNKFLALSLTLLAIFASNAFALLRSPYPVKPAPPDRIVISTAENQDSVQTAVRTSK